MRTCQIDEFLPFDDRRSGVHLGQALCGDFHIARIVCGGESALQDEEVSTNPWEGVGFQFYQDGSAVVCNLRHLFWPWQITFDIGIGWEEVKDRCSGVFHSDGLLGLAAVSSIVCGGEGAHDGVVACGVAGDGFACHVNGGLSAIVRRRSVVKEQFYGAL